MVELLKHKTQIAGLAFLFATSVVNAGDKVKDTVDNTITLEDTYEMSKCLKVKRKDDGVLTLDEAKLCGESVGYGKIELENNGSKVKTYHGAGGFDDYQYLKSTKGYYRTGK